MKVKNNFEKDVLNSLWIDEINRETEHYYQGELQQESRLSWLMTLEGAMLAIIAGFTLDIESGKIQSAINIGQALTIFLPLFISIILTAIGLFPLQGSKDRIIFLNYRNQGSRTIDLIKLKFTKNKDLEEADYMEFVYHHFLSHLSRSVIKRRFVLISMLSLVISLLSILINIFILVA